MLRLDEMSRLLVVRYDGLGDLVVTTGFLRELRRAAPQAKISLLVRPEWEPLMRANPNIDEVLGFPLTAYPRFHPLLQLRDVVRYGAQELVPRNFEAVILPQTHFTFFEARYLAWFSGAPHRIGRLDPNAPGDPAGWRLLTRTEVAPSTGHEADALQLFLQQLGGKPKNSTLELHWPAAVTHAVANRLGKPSLSSGPWIAFGLGASQKEKIWPVERFIAVARRWGGKNGKFLLIGGADVSAAAERFATEVPGNVDNLAGMLDLQETCAALALCDLFIGCDSGPMHLAAAVGTPVVEVVGWPIDVPPTYPGTPLRIGPYCQHRRIVQPSGRGRPLALSLDDVSEDAVANAAESLLDEVGLKPRQ